ncbi:hypothetical protein [Caballeronia sp. INDeC2]|jgi:hypothetical protein|uniref:hypothetical protein n=1 Tax=Caballeronia sp. INDeC2 TaxID=2921747 RepID=UPI00202901A3|nr:hypothetical protein [Caballeronia sp. INDeC2]
MQTLEGADDAEIVIRPRDAGGWRIEFPRGPGMFVAVVSQQHKALMLARQLQPSAHIRILPGRD